jgi:hypothetical protein
VTAEPESLLSGAWAKLDRAVLHANELKDEMRRFVASNRAPLTTYRRELNQETGEGRYVVCRVRRLPVGWSLLIGDSLNNARNALDHLAWLLVQAGSEPKPKNPNAVQFPIYDNLDAFEKNLPQRLPGVDPLLVRLVRRRQPVPGGADFEIYKHLGVLQSLVNDDKHRQLHLVSAAHTSVNGIVEAISGYELAGSEPGRDLARQPLVPRVGDEFVRFWGTVKEPDPQIQLVVVGEFVPAFEDGSSVTDTLDAIAIAVQATLSVFDSRF